MRLKLFVLPFFISCILSVNAQVEISMIQPIRDNFVESELFEQITFIPLQYERANTIMPDMELKIDENNYFILDNRLTQNVYRFNENGELTDTITTQKKIEESSKTPVLNNPVKFNINPTLKQVEIFTFENLLLNRFDYSGKKIDQISFPISPSDFIRDQNGNYWIYTGWNNKESQFRLFQTDKNGKTIDRKLRLVSNCTPIESFAFSGNKNSIFLWELLGNLTYRIENNNLKETFFLKYGIKDLSPAFHSISAYDSYQMLNRNGYYSVKKYLENDNYAYLFLNFNSSSGKDMFHIIYDKKNKKAYRYFENAAISAFDKAQALTENNELVFMVSPRKIRQLSSSETDILPYQFDELVEASSSIKNTIIVKIQLLAPANIFNGEE